MEVFDFTYIDDKIIGGVEKNLPSIAEIVAIVEKRATGKVSSKLSKSFAAVVESQEGLENTSQSKLSQMLQDEPPKKQPTVPKPFNITKIKPKVLPEPEALKREVKANPIPKQLFKKNLEEVELEKKERRQQKKEEVV